MPQQATDHVNTHSLIIQSLYSKSMSGDMHPQREGKTEPTANSVQRTSDVAVAVVYGFRQSRIVGQIKGVRERAEYKAPI